MAIDIFSFDRRNFIRSAALFSSALFVPGAMAEQLTRTPEQTEGPFYPDRMPLDTDNDLLVLNDSINPAVGEITHLTGKVLDANGSPVRNAVVEIWQVDNGGCYLHSGSSNQDKKDTNFQGFGRFLTSSTGEYYFRTIKPVIYPGRTRHIHFAINKGDKRLLTTQLYVKGEPQNEKDGILRGIADQKVRDNIIRDFAPIPNSKLGELAVNFDIVLGFTPEG